jgi:hypothetical protein
MLQLRPHVAPVLKVLTKIIGEKTHCIQRSRRRIDRAENIFDRPPCAAAIRIIDPHRPADNVASVTNSSSITAREHIDYGVDKPVPLGGVGHCPLTDKNSMFQVSSQHIVEKDGGAVGIRQSKPACLLVGLDEIGTEAVCPFWTRHDPGPPDRGECLRLGNDQAMQSQRILPEHDCQHGIRKHSQAFTQRQQSESVVHEGNKHGVEQPINSRQEKTLLATKPRIHVGLRLSGACDEFVYAHSGEATCEKALRGYAEKKFALRIRIRSSHVALGSSDGRPGQPSQGNLVRQRKNRPREPFAFLIFVVRMNGRQIKNL